MPSFSNLDEINTMSVLEAAIDYQGRGLTVTPLRGKRPILRSWQERYQARMNCPIVIDGRNLGMVLGGAGLVDVDLDNSVAVVVAIFSCRTLWRQNEESTLASLVCLRSCSPSRRYFLTKPMADRLMIESREATLVRAQDIKP